MERLIFVGLLLTPALLVGCVSLSSGVANRTLVPEVERRVDSVLPVGSTRQEIEAWLAGNGIEHSYTERPLVHRGAGIHWGSDEDCSGIIVGVIRNTDHSLLVSGNIQVVFVLGRDGHLVRRTVDWVGTGP
jgi:hypothetical protein